MTQSQRGSQRAETKVWRTSLERSLFISDQVQIDDVLSETNHAHMLQPSLEGVCIHLKLS